MSQVRITLEKPFILKGTMEEIPLVLRYGTTDARLIQQNSMASFAGVDANADEFVDAGAFRSTVPRAIRRMKPGRPITWELVAGDPDKCSVIVAVEAARLWFGDWRIPVEAEFGTPPEETYNWERNRVAARWGWWIMPQTTATGMSHTNRGSDAADTTKIGKPKVPHVLIEDVNDRGVIGSRLTYRPWDHFKWEADVVDIGANAAPVSQGIETFTIDQLRAIVAAHDQKTQAPKGK